MVNFNVVVFGGGSGLGKAIVETELSLGSSVLAFTSKKQVSVNSNLSYKKIDFNKLNVQLIDEVISKYKVEKFYFCSVNTNYKKFVYIDPQKIHKEITFNTTNILILIQLILKRHSKSKQIV